MYEKMANEAFPPGTFHRAQILTLGGVLCRPILSCGKNFS